MAWRLQKNCVPGIKIVIIIFITAVEDYVFQAFDVGAFHYLVKPFTEEKFIEILHNSAEQFIYQKKLNRAYIKKRSTRHYNNLKRKTYYC